MTNIIIPSSRKEYVQMLRRHEMTAKDENGKKLDAPTSEGKQRAYEEARDLGSTFSDYEKFGFHSVAKRTEIAVGSWLNGFHDAGAKASYEIELKKYLNSFGEDIDPAVRQRIRDLPKDQQKNAIYSPEFLHLLQNNGYRMAKGLVAEAMNPRYKNLDRVLTVNVSHGPASDATELALLGIEINRENIEARPEGPHPEGSGFQVTYRPDGLVTLERQIIKPGDRFATTVDEVEMKAKDLVERVHEYQLNK